MRRKSTRTSGKQSPEKAKQTDSPANRKSRRTSKRRRKSTSESENTEDDQEAKNATEQVPPNDGNAKNTSDAENNDVVNAKEIEKEEMMDKHEKKIKLKRNRSGATTEGHEIITEEKYSRRSRRRGSPKMEEKTLREDDDDDRKDKGKSKGKTKSAKIEKSQPPNESETHNESDISTNAQVTAQSPQIVNTNLMVDNVVDVAENAEDNKSRENEPNEEDRTGDTNTKDVKDNCDENNTVEENIKPIGDDVQTNDVITVDESIKSNVNNCEENGSRRDSSSKEIESIEICENARTEEAAICEPEKITENVQIETVETETAEINNKTADDFTGFTQDDKSISKDTSQFAEEPMDISMDVTFTLKTDDASINVTEAEEATEDQQIQTGAIVESTPIEEKTLPTQEEPEKAVYTRKIVVRRATTSKSDAPREKGWGSSTIYLDLVNQVKIDTEIIQNIYSDVQFLDESEVKLDMEVKDRRRSLTETKERKRFERSVSSNDSDSRKYDTQTDDKEQEEDNTNIIALNRKISIVDDSASKLKPPPSPAKNPVSSVLFITNLVRPFTLKQLKELLERTGTIKENCFWTDRIKSKCYVQYENVEDSEATRNALHGVHWPIGNGKKLIIDYGTEEDLDNARNPPATPPIPEQMPKIEKENQESLKKLQEEEEERNREKLKEKRRHEHIREWDVGKTDTHRGRSRSRTREKPEKRKHSRHSPSPFEDYLARKQKKAEDQIPQKLMDDLFQKTKITPSIYWQPLSPEEIATKQQQRLERMAEHKRRLEESTRNRADFGRGGPYRRRYD